jgi:DNA processing protein
VKIATESDAFLALAHLCEPADESINRKLASGVSPIEVLDLLLTTGFPKRDHVAFGHKFDSFNVEAELEFSQKIGARILTRDQEGWPTQLNSLGVAQPWALWAIGSIDFRVVALSSVTIVGTRACTPYGAGIGSQWAADLGKWGTNVFSGGAIGIDSHAHRGALSVGAPTVAVLASGVHTRYPASHEHLFAQIIDNGAIVSESPPREAAQKRRFLARNRILAGLTKATCVIEATDRSGTSSTAREALSMNRIVAGVPGSIHSPTSLGVNTLLKHKDVHVVTSSADLQELVSGFNPLQKVSYVGAAGGPNLDLGPDWRELSKTDYEIWELLPKRGGFGIDILCQKTGRSRLDLLARLSELHLTGLVTSTEGVWRKHSQPN